MGPDKGASCPWAAPGGPRAERAGRALPGPSYLGEQLPQHLLAVDGAPVGEEGRVRPLGSAGTGESWVWGAGGRAQGHRPGAGAHTAPEPHLSILVSTVTVKAPSVSGR